MYTKHGLLYIHIIVACRVGTAANAVYGYSGILLAVENFKNFGTMPYHLCICELNLTISF